MPPAEDSTEIAKVLVGVGVLTERVDSISHRLEALEHALKMSIDAGDKNVQTISQLALDRVNDNLRHFSETLDRHISQADERYEQTMRDIREHGNRIADVARKNEARANELERTRTESIGTAVAPLHKKIDEQESRWRDLDKKVAVYIAVTAVVMTGSGFGIGKFLV